MGKHREFGNFANTQRILFVQVVNSLILKVKDIAIFAVKHSIFFSNWNQVIFLYVIVTNRLAQGKFAVDRETQEI